jgi:hypothetical protein
MVLSVVLLLAGRLIFTSTEKGGIWAFGLLMVFYFFGAAHDFLKELKIQSFLVSYSFVLPALLVFFMLFTVLIKKRKRKFIKFTFFLNILFSIFVLVELALLSFSMVTNKEKRLSLSGNNKPIDIEINQTDERLKPDIFFIIFDEYTSSASLKKYLNFNNENIDSVFLQKGCYIVHKSKSNYNATPLSIAATLNMNYLGKPLEGEQYNAELILRSCKAIKFTMVPELLKKGGYKIKNFGLFDLSSQPVLTSNFFDTYTEKLIYLQTLWGRIQKDIWWNVVVRLNKNAERDDIQREVERNIINFKATVEELNIENDTPKFVYTHIMMPHEPYFFKKDGMPLTKVVYNSDPSKRDSLYLNQLIYTNTWIKKLVENIPPGHKRPLVVIIQGDHGFRGEWPISYRERQFTNLNTFYFSDKNYNLLYDSIGSVNTFRVIFNKYFNANLPLLRDSTVLVK